jgi:type I restriction enzyme, S subunit
MSTREMFIDKSSWTVTKFGDVAIQQKVNVNREDTSLTKYVKGEHMSSEDIHLRSWGELQDEYLGPAFIRYFEEGDILYGSRRTYLKKVSIAPFEGITSNTTFVIKAKEEKIDKRLLPFLMLSDGFTEHSIMHSKGSVNPYINWKDLAKYEFLLPPKDQQAQLAKLLWAMDDVIESEKKVLNTVKINQAVCLKNFFDENTKEIQLKKLGEIITGSTPSTKKEEYWNGDIQFVTPADIEEQVLIKETERYISNEGLKVTREIPANSVMVVCIASVGKIAISNERCATNQQINTIIPKGGVDYRYLYNTLKLFNHRIISRAAKSVVPILNKGDFSLIKIPVLENDKQQNFVQLAEKFEHSINNLKSKIYYSQSLQKSIINQIF